MSTKLNPLEQEIEALRSVRESQEDTIVRPSLRQIVAKIQQDCREDAESYLRETEVPHGGE